MVAAVDARTGATPNQGAEPAMALDDSGADITRAVSAS